VPILKTRIGEAPGPPDRDRAIAFLRAEGYGQAIDDADRMFVVTLGPDVVAAVRLAIEHGVLMLRGMRVRTDMRRRGVGLQLLQRVEREIGQRTCYGIPFAWLEVFYGRIGFRKIPDSEAPPFLVERARRYRQRGLDVIVIRRP
jgi:predicted N-acetyltransferase YhbS